MTTITDDDLWARNQLLKNGDACLLASIAFLYRLHPIIDAAKIDEVFLPLSHESEEVKRCLVREVNHRCRDKENSLDLDPFSYARRAEKAMSAVRMTFLDTEWDRAVEQLSGDDNVTMCGTVDPERFPDEDADARWIDIHDNHGRSFAHVSIDIDSLDGGWGSTATVDNSEHADGFFTIHVWSVEGGAARSAGGTWTSPVVDGVRIEHTRDRDRLSTNDDLCGDIVFTVREIADIVRNS